MGELSWLMSELFAAKLNKLYGTTRGEDLAAAKVYATFNNVAAELGTGDSRLAICRPDSGQLAAMAASAAKLSLVNMRFTDNRW